LLSGCKGHDVFGSERRRQSGPERAVELRRGLTHGQLATIHTMESFHWALVFVRRPLFRDPIPVLFHPLQERHVVVQADGSIDEAPAISIRG
jgi:hypothetical protein